MTFRFRTKFAEDIFRSKYSQGPDDSWPNLCRRLVNDVCGDRSLTAKPTTYSLMSKADQDQLVQYMIEMKFIPGGRYLYYAGRPASFFNNCFVFIAEEDTREEWARIAEATTSALMSGGGIGVDYSILRPSGRTLSRTGGISSGPIPLIHIVNEIGRNVIQGGSRRSAMFASLNWQHEDIQDFITAKNWSEEMKRIKAEQFDFPLPLDMTNISVNWDTDFIDRIRPSIHTGEWSTPDIWYQVVRQMCQTGEPGMCFNFYENEKDTGRNACVTGDTQILTIDGYHPIEQLVGIPTQIWNGFEFSKVTPFSTGTQKTVKVSLSDGTTIQCTPDHKFILLGDTRKEAQDLTIGDKLEKFEMPTIITGVDYDRDAYSQGFYSGDGHTNLTYSYVYHTKYDCIPRLRGSFNNTIYTDKQIWRHGPMFDKSWVPIRGHLKYCIEWLAGLLDSDGTVTRDKHGNGLQITSINKQFLLDVKLMLTRLGVRAKVVSGNEAGYKLMPNGKGGSTDYFCQTTWRLLIGNTDTYYLVTHLDLVCNRLNISHEKPQRDARRFVYVLSVEESTVESTYCFTEMKNHSGVFNGIVTGQCTEFTSEDSDDVCNLGSINLGNISSITELRDVVNLASKFLVCGTIRGELPYAKVREVRERNRKIGLGLMGVHEWLLQRGYSYEVNDELKSWLEVYRSESERAAREHCDRFYLSHPKKYRAVAPAGTIGILASTTTGIEPLFSVSYKRRYLVDGNRWKYQYVIDGTAKRLIEQYGLSPDSIETSYNLAGKPEQRIKFQADVQDFIDMGISSTINLPEWGGELNNEDTYRNLGDSILRYCHRLRGITCFPSGSRGFQPLNEVPYKEALAKEGIIFEEENRCSGGVCGI